MNDPKTLVERLTRKTVAGQPVFNTPIEQEAADRIRELEAQLAKLEHETRGQTFQTPDEKDARIRSLEELLCAYGEHDASCKAHNNACTCGFTKALLECGLPATKTTLREYLELAGMETPVRKVHSKSEHKRLAALGVESVVTSKETKGDSNGI